MSQHREMRSALLTLVMVLLCAQTALADPGDLLLVGGAGASFPEEASTRPSGLIDFAVEIDDTFVLDVRAMGQGSTLRTNDAVFGTTVGVRYRIDVSRWIPYLRGGVGFAWAPGDHGILGDAVAEFGAGLRWYATKRTAFGLEATNLMALTEADGIGSAPRIMLVVGYDLQP